LTEGKQSRERFMKLTKRQTAHVLAALRHSQQCAGDVAEQEPLTLAEIDELCEIVQQADGENLADVLGDLVQRIEGVIFLRGANTHKLNDARKVLAAAELAQSVAATLDDLLTHFDLARYAGYIGHDLIRRSRAALSRAVDLRQVTL
jgi:predicted house-cleaning noncanonical NTP pyrophosphatase (MazG superfamily)